MPTLEQAKSRKMRRGGRRSSAPPRSLISLLWASSTLSTSEVKGHTKYISECHLRGKGGGRRGKKKGERGRRNDRPPPSSSPICIEVNRRAVPGSVFLSLEP